MYKIDAKSKPVQCGYTLQHFFQVACVEHASICSASYYWNYHTF